MNTWIVFPPESAADLIPYGILYLVVISLIAVIVTVSDKRKARNGAWRVPEATLLILAAMGGSAAMYLTMHVIRHKTKHIKFMLGIPLIMVFQGIAVLYIRHRLGL
ncbi:MAG: DUF1294 domain-containing protein [Ruminococcaceae bacterium]|nr:DUF1294 domain-containing protein [Oscillospiraceae bacterium]